jgi:hypothetical protein
MKIKPITPAQLRDVHTAMYCLKVARNRLSRAGCANAAGAVRAAMKSADGALRRAERRARA